jgi:hypothetical protein
MHSNRGVYALLLGSGVSRSAAIPTGWEVVLDLIRKLAAMRGEVCDPDSEESFHAAFREAPTYSGLLKKLCRTPAERQQLRNRPAMARGRTVTPRRTWQP